MAQAPETGLVDRASQTTAVPDFISGFCDPARRRLLLIAAILASAMGFIDGTVVAIAMPAMRETLGATLAQAQWISNAYMLTLSALILSGGAAGDRFGLARVFSIGIAVFMAASLACAAAPSSGFLIAARAVQGFGAALMVPGSLALIARAYPEAERGRAIGIWAAASSLTTALGPVIGGAVLSFGGPEMWRAIFAVNLPIGIAALWLIRRAVNEDTGQPGQPIDYAGSVLAVLGLGLLAWSLSAGGSAAQRLAFAASGLAALTLFVRTERRAPAPMLDLTLFRNRSFSAANLLTFCLYFALSAILFFLPMTVIAAWGVTELEATAAFAPLSVFIASLSSTAGRLSDRFGPGPPIAAGSALVALAYAGLGLTTHLMRFWDIVVPLMCLMGLGMSLVVAPLSAAVMQGIAEHRTGAASGVNNAVARIAGLVAVAAMGTVASVAYATVMVAVAPPDYAGPGSFGAPGTDPAHLAASNGAFAAVALITALLATASALIAWLGLDRRRRTA
ncbi:MFS transporter [Pseudoruegeria sp. HB172150]|uniref:MFS transporter n=1 Tax=Pseudoruegeria sp. HB172150 TaxID=2721164 RepID=UPI0020A69784|nr:MFS transporter [Pseudoruegeria sp. HB172150]